MKLTLLLVLTSLTTPLWADTPGDTFTMHFNDTRLAEAATLINQYCGAQVPVIEVKNPNQRITYKANAVSCTEAAGLLTRFDKRSA
jgi:hypothetical protein